MTEWQKYKNLKTTRDNAQRSMDYVELNWKNSLYFRESSNEKVGLYLTEEDRIVVPENELQDFVDWIYRVTGYKADY